MQCTTMRGTWLRKTNDVTHVNDFAGDLRLTYDRRTILPVICISCIICNFISYLTFSLHFRFPTVNYESHDRAANKASPSRTARPRGHYHVTEPGLRQSGVGVRRNTLFGTSLRSHQ